MAETTTVEKSTGRKTVIDEDDGSTEDLCSGSPSTVKSFAPFKFHLFTLHCRFDDFRGNS